MPNSFDKFSILFDKLEIDAIIITGTDPHQLEYPQQQFRLRHVISGFNGSAGTLVLIRNNITHIIDSALFTDGRYEEEAKLTLSNTTQLCISNEVNWASMLLWLQEKIISYRTSTKTDTMSSSSPKVMHTYKVAFCNLQITAFSFQLIELEIAKNNLQQIIELVSIKYQNLIFEISKLMPEIFTQLITQTNNKSTLKTFNHKYAQLEHTIWNIYDAQQTFSEKTKKQDSYLNVNIVRFSNFLNKIDAEIYVSANIHELAWLLEIRSIYLHTLMVFPCFFIFNIKAKAIHLAIPQELNNEHSISQITSIVIQVGYAIYFENYNEIIDNPSHFLTIIYDQSVDYNAIVYDSLNIPVAFLDMQFRSITSPLAEWKSIFSQQQIEDTKTSFFLDGIAMLEALSEVAELLVHGKVLTEADIDTMLLSQRIKMPYYLQVSFDSIIGFGSNSVLPHYKTSTTQKIDISKPLLIDCGAHYLYGTTDLTRVYYFGAEQNIDPLLKEDFTFVLKAHIALALYTKKLSCSAYPSGKELDSLGRNILQESGRSFNHGTGHGIGYCTDVHEGIQRINQKYNNAILPGILMSNEPGFYRTDKWGIRIENCITTKVEEEHVEGNAQIKYSIETLSYYPIQRSLININLLSQEELAWLDNYQHHCADLYAKHLSPRALKFLEFQIKA